MLKAKLDKSRDFSANQLGTKWWHFNDLIHRENGPAIEFSCGTKTWYLNSKYHRENGPAIEYSNGVKWWYLNGDEYTEEEYNKELKRRGLK